MPKDDKKSLDELIKLIRSARGSLKRPGQKPFAEWMAELNAEEKELEEARYQRLVAAGRKNRN